MIDERSEFDFAAWLSEPAGSSFHDCVRAAVDCLALDNGDLRSRLAGALFCLSCCREKNIPERFRPDFDAIQQEVKQRAETEGEIFRLRDVGYDRLREWSRKCKLRTAVRLARKVLEMDRASRI